MTARLNPVVVGAIAVLSAFVLTAGIVVVVARISDKTGPPHPKEWDARVLDLVSFDEQHRGLKFDQPVFVDFLDAKAYSDRIRGDASKLTDQDRKDLDNSEGELRALGLMKGNVDLFSATNDLVDTGTLAFYDPTTERITVRGTEMSVDLRVTLVHELVHVLQDQNFSIGEDRRSQFNTSQESTSFRAVLEGDAVRIENEYIDSLSTDDKAAYDAAHKQDVNDVTTGLSKVPAALQAFQAAPYIFGPPFMTALDDAGGQSSVDDALRNPPTTDEQLMDPAVFEQKSKALTIDTPFLQRDVTDQTKTDQGDLGWVTWYLFLAERIDPQVALQAADGWGGDAYVAFSKDGKTCMNIAWQGDTSTDDQEMRAALDQWMAAMPSGPTVETDGDLLLLRTCDPGEESGITVADRALDTIQLPGTRSELVPEFVTGAHLGLPQAYEAADCVTRSLSFDELAAVNRGDKPPDDARNAIQRAVPGCVPR